VMTIVKEGTFGPAEAIILLAISSSARMFLTYPRSLVETAGSAAWLTPLGGLAVALAGVYVMSLVLKKNPDKSIVEITEEAWGPVIGTVFNLVTVTFFMAVSALFIREFTEALIIAALPRTPISVISIVFISIGLLGAYLGIEAMARSARLSYLYVLGGIAILLLALIPQWNIHNLFPLLGCGPLQVFGAGAYSTAAITEIILAAVLVQSMGGADKFSSIGYKAMLFGFGLLFALMLTLNLSINKEVAEEISLPFYRLSRSIYLGRFFQRIEAIFVIIWSIIGALKIALTLYGASVTLARTLKLPDYRPLIWPLGLAIFIFSFLPLDMPTAVRLDFEFLRPYALLPSYVIPLFVLAAFWLKGRGKRAGS